MCPEVVLRSIGYSHVFRLTGGGGNRLLLATAPGYRRVAEFKDITGEAASCVETVGVGGVQITVEL